MKSICFVLTVGVGTRYSSPFSLWILKNGETLKSYFSQDYDVSINYEKDKDHVEYLVVPDPFVPYEDQKSLPEIKVSAKLFYENDFKGIKEIVDRYFKETAR